MSTEEDGHTLTRRQLRELRLTGSTPVVSGEEAAAAQAAQTDKSHGGRIDAASADDVDRSTDSAADRSVGADSAGSSEAAPVSSDATPSAAPLTRRAARAQERARTGPVPVTPPQQQSPEDVPVAAPQAVEEPVEDAIVVEEPVVEEPVVDAIVVEESAAEESAVEEPVVEKLIVDVPVAAAPAAAVREGEAGSVFAPQAAQTDPSNLSTPSHADTEDDTAGEDTAAADSEPERPMVGAAFGIGVKRSPSGPGIPTAFDDLLETGSAGSHKTASTLIFTPSPGAGSLSGPVASTGELLITGTYALPDGMGSQGHALGTTDGKDIDAVLIDGELAPASSPTPIAASSAISTSKPAGEVIRPPVPDKGSKLTLTLAIVAGGLALALAAALIIAFTTGVLG
ncbi:hypothetical protein [Microbacterium sp. nov. GSS16]|uniref:hypothetical protein n=1 Tax=Microbacterium sp. nov. GSS16 TaxID=3019890 RepID=UPI002305A8A8|nr:hypothetical protein [Microbacterium sp. nov. GSS16]WCD91944.1 hypothetical protein PGB26_09665 [Microbacterium sp. nov. GSS16]